MDEKNCPLKLVVQEQFLRKEPCFQRSKGLSYPEEQSCSQEKKRLSLGNNHVPKKINLKLLQGTTMLLKEKEFLFPRT